MENMDGWSVARLAVGVYVAVVSLARLMLRRREEMMEQFRREVEKEKRRRLEAKAKERQKPLKPPASRAA